MCFFLEVLARFSRWSYNIYCKCFVEAVGTYFKTLVQYFGGTKIEEQTCNLLQKILERILRSLSYFLCEDLA
jgi:hypothetical protein